jgi:hypothetical protein
VDQQRGRGQAEACCCRPGCRGLHSHRSVCICTPAESKGYASGQGTFSQRVGFGDFFGGMEADRRCRPLYSNAHAACNMRHVPLQAVPLTQGASGKCNTEHHGAAAVAASCILHPALGYVRCLDDTLHSHTTYAVQQRLGRAACNSQLQHHATRKRSMSREQSSFVSHAAQPRRMLHVAQCYGVLRRRRRATA